MIKRVLRRFLPWIDRQNVRVGDVEQAIRELQLAKEEMPGHIWALIRPEFDGIVLAHATRSNAQHESAIADAMSAVAEHADRGAMDARDQAIEASRTHVDALHAEQLDQMRRQVLVLEQRIADFQFEVDSLTVRSENGAEAAH